MISHKKGVKMRNILFFGLLWILLTSQATAALASSTTTAPTNIMVDFDSTSFDSSMSPGESGIMTLTIKNTGGYRAESVQVYVPGTSSVTVDKTFYIGRLAAGESKSMPVLVRVKPEAKTGLAAINVRISFDGFDSQGVKDNNKLTTWDVPLRIYGKPMFQLSPEKTTYYVDNLETFQLSGLVIDSVKDLRLTLASECMTVMGSTSKYVGSVGAGEKFTLDYQVKPSTQGACTASVLLEYTDESGSPMSNNISLGINVEGAGVDFKVTNVSYGIIGPGESTILEIALKNIGKAKAQDVTVSLDLAGITFVPVQTAEKYIGSVEPQGQVNTDFNVAVTWNAELSPYSIPLNIDYNVGGSSYTVTKDIGVDVTGRVELEVISVEQTGSQIRVTVANMGTRIAEAVKATLTPLAAAERAASNQDTPAAGRPAAFAFGKGNASAGLQSSQEAAGALGRDSQIQRESFIDYKSDIKATRQTTFTFATPATGSVQLALEYVGQNNDRVRQVQQLTVGGSSAVTRTARTTNAANASAGFDYVNIAYLLAFAALAYAGIRYYRQRRPNAQD
jgi:hypothetical protein